MKKPTELSRYEKFNVNQDAQKARNLELLLKKEDDKLMRNRKKLGFVNWKVKGFRFKTMTTRDGEVNLKRRLYYRDNLKTGEKEYIFLLDYFWDIPKYSRFFESDLKTLKENILGKQLYKDASSFLNLKGTPQTKTTRVYKLLKAINKREAQEPEAPEEIAKLDLSDEKLLYLEIDDTFGKLRWNDTCENLKYQCRLLATHTGKTEIATEKDQPQTKKNQPQKIKNQPQKIKNQRSLVCFYQAKTSLKKMNQADLLEIFHNHLAKNYVNYQHCQIIVNGDGAGWIKNLAKKLNVPFVLDKFHLMQNINQAFIKQPKAYKTVGSPKHLEATFNRFCNQKINRTLQKTTKWNFLEEGPEIWIKRNFKLFCELNDHELSATNLEVQRKIFKPFIKKTKKLFKYITNNLAGIKNLFHAVFSIGVRTEAMISNLIKSHLRGRTFSLSTAILKIKQNSQILLL